MQMIDTLKYTKRLQAAGVGREAAELQAEALTEVLAGAVETVLVTKEDLRHTEQQLNTKIDAVDKRMDAMELRLTSQMHAMMVKTIGILGVLMALFSTLTAVVHVH